MNQIAPEHEYPSPSLRSLSSSGEKASKAHQPFKDIHAATKPSLTNTLPGLVVLLSVLLTFSFFVLMLSTLVGLQLGNTLLHPSPFGGFEALWPGQSIVGLSAYARHTARGYLPCVTSVTPPRHYLGLQVQFAAGAYNGGGSALKCADYPKDDVFRTVNVTIENNRIQQLEFYSDVLPEDGLLLYWGMPDSITQSGNPQIVNLYWERKTYSALASVIKSDLVVRLLTLIAKE